MSEIGVFSQSDLKELVRLGRIQTLPGFKNDHVQPASIDITVSEEAYCVKTLMRPSGVRRERIRDMLSGLGAEPVAIGSVLVPGKKYLAKATINTNFPTGLYAYANAKSTSGRNFLLTRTLADDVGAFDTLDRRRSGWSGEVWLSLEPLVFPVLLTDKQCYAQVRVFDGDTRIKSEELLNQILLKEDDLLYRQDGSRYKQGELSLSQEDGSVLCTLYAKAGKLIGFRAQNSGIPLDLCAKGLDPRPYFEPVYAETDPCNQEGGCVTIEPGWFYLFSTNEMLKVPQSMCAELRALDTRLGIFFSHFAGFFDPGFFGVPTLEVATIVPTTLRHKQEVASFMFESMRSKTSSYGDVGNYQKQRRTTLPKQFAMPEDWAIAME